VLLVRSRYNSRTYWESGETSLFQIARYKSTDTSNFTIEVSDDPGQRATRGLPKLEVCSIFQIGSSGLDCDNVPKAL
jgi:hypothetical protein